MSTDDTINLSKAIAEANEPALVDGRITIELTDEELDDASELAPDRNRSYADGRTTDTNYTDSDGETVHEMGLMGEYALAQLYWEASVDRSISAAGDGGVDCQLRIDGELVDVDLKTNSYPDPWLMVREDNVHGNADIYVLAYVDTDDARVEFIGYVTAEELLQEENLEESPSRKFDHLNYTIKRGFERLPEPDLDDDRVDYDV